ncbi:cation transporter [Vibrio parahaemolyticus O1:K58]|uniref:cation diffusion facilitator family transporter n=1 Tax=Vibrio parahaemolyticus TaxID=670 RepID=UPI0012B2F8E6|nr:cation transporter [Vibrio parahaemolyticus]EJG0951955.1 cation transporter [Vibrio parahaemolyticus O1:K58]EHV9720158.1 cation transporter [Vibrio parahaemolyticus]EIZ1365853.1 cation transporter [Vibrio parahaemolyticus]EKO5221070.1 cation transporter [Vibrio parahaemolyticus]EKO7418420.1 cation transporter [Vibrio parahaemolyticus]
MKKKTGSLAMPVSTKNQERNLIQFSIAMGSIYTLVGVIWGILIQSGIILFDAIYSGVSILLSMMTMYALVIISRDNSVDAEQYRKSNFHMGRTAVEPLVNMIKSLVIISICLYGFVSAVLAIHQGGVESENTFSGIYYGLITASICTCSWFYLKFFSKQHNDLVQAECEQWMVDAIFSLLVVVSFVISQIMTKTELLQNIAGYVDPISVIVATTYFIKVPVKRLIKSIRELLVMAPEKSIQQEIDHVLQPFLSLYSFDEHISRTTKTGRQLFVDITFVIGEPNRKFEIQQLDEIRSQIEANLKPLCSNIWLTVSFTHDRYWA